MPAEVLERHHVGVDDLAGGIGVRVLNVIAVQERVLHDLPVGRLVEAGRAEAHQVLEVVAGQDRVHLRSEPLGDVDRGLRIVHDPDESVALLAGQLDQAVLAAVDVAEGVVAGDHSQ